MTPYFLASLIPICNFLNWLFSSPLFFLLPPKLFPPPPPTHTLFLPFPPACCSFLNLWISEHHFLDFSTPQGDILIPAPSLFSPHFLPPEWISQTGCEVTVLPMEVMVVVCVCVFVCGGKCRGWRWIWYCLPFFKKPGLKGQCLSKSNPTHDHGRRRVTLSFHLGSKLWN